MRLRIISRGWVKARFSTSRKPSPDDPDRIPFRFFLVQKRNSQRLCRAQWNCCRLLSLHRDPRERSPARIYPRHKTTHVIPEHSCCQSEFNQLNAPPQAGGVAASVDSVPIAPNGINLTEGAIAAGHSPKMGNQADRNRPGLSRRWGCDPARRPVCGKPSSIPLSLPSRFLLGHSQHLYYLPGAATS